MLKTLCQFNLQSGVDPDEFWHTLVEDHAPATLAVAGDALAGYLLNRSDANGAPAQAPYQFTVELYFDSVEERTRFLTQVETIDDDFDAQVQGFVAYAVDELVMRTPSHHRG
ncbi:MAG: EthD domain-containing protein [Nocardioides sp.]|uniref:EthD domain-containing protein n=1 Tax=Nocardioides sp. TaxID=35761 RepID=UPI0039E5CF52